MSKIDNTTAVNADSTPQGSESKPNLYPFVYFSLSKETNPFYQSAPQPPSVAAPTEASPSTTTTSLSENPFWGTHVMGTPSVPSSNPDNKKVAALYSGSAGTNVSVADNNQSNPCLQYTPTEKAGNSPLLSVLHVFNSWSNKAETLANNIWHNHKL